MCDSCDSHSFSGFSTYGRNVSTSLLGPSRAPAVTAVGQRDPIDVAIGARPRISAGICVGSYAPYINIWRMPTHGAKGHGRRDPDENTTGVGFTACELGAARR